MRLVPVHHHKAQVPLEVVQHQKRLSRSGENLIGELATWDGQMDDGLLVRFVPARVASLYTATNAMEPKFRSAFLKRYALIIVKSQSSIVALYSKHTRTLTFKEFEGRQEQRKRALRPAFACPVREDEDGSKTFIPCPAVQEEEEEATGRRTGLPRTMSSRSSSSRRGRDCSANWR
jgi:hypothetical protein